jgi:hypothetical protein
VSVTADDPRYDDWPSRKPSKNSKLAAKLRDRPLELAAEEGSKHVARQLRSKARSSLGTAAKTAIASSAGLITAAAASAAILATAYVVADQIAKNQRVKLGDRINAISQRFVAAQQDIERKYGTTRWADVPADVRAKWLSDYKRALGTANSQAQGSAFVGVRESYK